MNTEESPPREGWWSKLKRVRKIEWISALLLCGVALTIFRTGLPSPLTDEVKIAPEQSASGEQSPDATARELERVLSAMRGAGEVRVMLAYEKAEVPAFGISGGAESDRERPIGAIVVAQGAGDIEVRLELARAVRTLLGLPAESVDVFTMEQLDAGAAKSETDIAEGD